MSDSKKNYNIIQCSKGLTLIEILVVLIILGIFAVIAFPRIIGKPEEARQQNRACRPLLSPLLWGDCQRLGGKEDILKREKSQKILGGTNISTSLPDCTVILI